MFILVKERDYIVHDDKNIKGFYQEFRFLSNFEKCEIYFDNELYGSTEAAYMAGKSLNHYVRKQFSLLSSITPSEARKLGQVIELRSDWEQVKYDTMAAVVFDKFYRHKELRDKLLATGNKYLEETNHWNDCYWGVCNGVGENNLGKILMKVREFWQK